MDYRVDYVIADGEDDRFSVEVNLDDEVFVAILEADTQGTNRMWFFPRRDGKTWSLTLSELNDLIARALRELEPRR